MWVRVVGQAARGGRDSMAGPRPPTRPWFRFGQVSLAATLALAAGCSSESSSPSESTGDSPYEYVPEGKADDYRSTTGLEYSLIAKDSVTFAEADLALSGGERDERAKELVGLRFKALSFFIYEYLASKEEEDPNHDYGCVRTTFRQKTFESQGLIERADQPGTFDFTFEAEVGGPKDLMRNLPLRDGKTFDLKLPILSTAEL